MKYINVFYQSSVIDSSIVYKRYPQYILKYSCSLIVKDNVLFYKQKHVRSVNKAFIIHPIVFIEQIK